MSRVLVLSGGSPHAHDFDAIRPALVEVVRAGDHTVQFADHPARAAELLGSERFDALVVHGLWWRMLDPAYEPWRADHAYETPPEVATTLADFVADGGGLVALHTAPVCFDDWPLWGDVLGASWHWGVSGHPPYGPVEATIVSDHPVVAGLGPTIALDDEIYGSMDMRQVDVLATARRSPDDEDQPVIWTHRFGDGRVVFDGFGHNAASIHHPQNAQVIQQAVAWVTAERPTRRAPTPRAPTLRAER